MRVLRDFILQALLVFMQIEPNHAFTARHGRGHGTGFQLEHIFDQLMLLLAQHPGQRTGFYHGVDVVGGDVIFTHHRQFKDAEDDVRQAVEEPHQRTEHEQAEAHRVDDTQSHSFWRNHTDAFRGQVSEQDEHPGDQREGENKAHLLGKFGGHVLHEQAVKGRRKRCIPHDTAENSDRVQANLYHGEERSRIFLHLQDTGSIDVAFVGKQLKFDFTGRGQRDLGYREKCADGYQTKYY